jgi:hypothetical protein
MIASDNEISRGAGRSQLRVELSAGRRGRQSELRKFRSLAVSIVRESPFDKLRTGLLPKWQVASFCAKGVEVVARCCAGLRRVARLGVGLAAKLGLEERVSLPAGDSVGMDAEKGGDCGDGLAGEEETGGRKLVWAQGFEGAG